MHLHEVPDGHSYSTDSFAATGGTDAEIEAARERLEVELDDMRVSREPFLGRYEVCMPYICTKNAPCTCTECQLAAQKH